MEKIKDKLKKPCKVISILSNIAGLSKAEYAINLAVALTKLTETNVILIDVCSHTSCGDILKAFKLERKASIEVIVNSERGIDVLALEYIKKQYLEEIKAKYQYAIINLPFEVDETVYGTLPYSDAIHFFIESTRDSLKNGYEFLENLFEKGLKDHLGKLKVIINRLNIYDKFSVEEMSWLLKRDIYSLVPEPNILDVPIDSKGTPLVSRSPNSEYSRAVMHIAKSEAGKLLGLALGSGAAFGLAHIGVLRIIEETHIPIDILSGSSIGALIASMWGLGFSSDKIERIAKRLKNKLNIMRLLDFTIPISGILAGKRLKNFLKNILGEKTFEDLEIPVKIIVYDLANRETFVIEKGPLVEAVYMSILVPGIFEPKTKNGRLIIDGGVSDPVPVDILLKQGVKKIIAVNVLPGPGDIYKRNMLLKERMKEEEAISRTGSFYMKLILFAKKLFRKIFTPNIFDVIMTSMQSIEFILAENSCRRASVTLRPVLSKATSTDFHLVKEFIERGKEEATSHIEEIKALVVG